MGKFEDFTGRKFGLWTVIEELGRGKVLCQCSCENKTIREVYKKSLKEGKTLSCGCDAVRKRNEKNFIDRTGQTFNSWTITKELGHGRVMAKCSCGKEKDMQKALIVNGYSKSCGHDRAIQGESYEDRWVGKKFGHWTVVSVDTSDHDKVLCRCDCYNQTMREVYKSHLKYGTSTSCGCQERIVYGLYELGDEYIDISTYSDLVGKQIGNWKILKLIGRTKNRQFNVLCECQCKKHTKKELDIHVLLSGRSRSCGCMTKELRKETLLNRYGDTVPIKAKDPREIWQIKVVDNAENLAKYILDNFKEKPTIQELALELCIHPTSMWHILKKYDQMDLIKSNTQSSYMENVIANYIRKNSCFNVINNDRSAIYPSELDIYIPDKHIAIEYNGDYWHNLQNKGMSYHRDKVLKCLDNNIRLIHIYEYNYYNSKYTNKFYKLIKGISSSYVELNNYNIEFDCDIEEFVYNNNIFNNKLSEHSLAVKINGEIFGSISFSRRKNENSIEISNITSKLDLCCNSIKLLLNRIKNIPNINKIYIIVNLDIDNVLELLHEDFKIAQLISIKPSYINSSTYEEVSKDSNYSNCIYKSGEAILIWSK